MSGSDGRCLYKILWNYKIGNFNWWCDVLNNTIFISEYGYFKVSQKVHFAVQEVKYQRYTDTNYKASWGSCVLGAYEEAMIAWENNLVTMDKCPGNWGVFISERLFLISHLYHLIV